MVTQNPLLGSGHAELPHPAPASGDDAQSHEGIGMADAGGREPAVHVPLHPAPGQVVALVAGPSPYDSFIHYTSPV